jgi:hypothetical protein
LESDSEAYGILKEGENNFKGKDFLKNILISQTKPLTLRPNYPFCIREKVV